MDYKYDLHCHVHEGSPDSKVSCEKYIELLQANGFTGMLITDHDSYKGYEHYLKQLSGTSNGNNEDTDNREAFYVLKGIEYDTRDAGHFIVVMPSDIDSKLLEYKGLSIRQLIDYVHGAGGILGPAHSFSEPFLSIFRTGRYKEDQSIATEFDFIEGFNSCEFAEDNERACKVAGRFDKPVTGGSDSHWEESVGCGYTELEEVIKSSDELIRYIKDKRPMQAGGRRYMGTLRDKLGPLNKILVYGFYPYNKLGALVNAAKRKKLLDLVENQN